MVSWKCAFVDVDRKNAILINNLLIQDTFAMLAIILKLPNIPAGTIIFN